MHDPKFHANWQSLKPLVQKRWPALRPAEIDDVRGDIEELAWFIQVRYGLSKATADIEIEGWLDSLEKVEGDRRHAGTKAEGER